MANPQRENGHTDIANELLEEMGKYHLSGNEWQIVFVVLRKTWGWQKKEDAISLTQFEIATHLSRPSVQEAINKLVLKKVLVPKRVLLNKQQGKSYQFNKNYDEWGSTEKSTTVVPKRVLPIQVKVVPKKVHTKEKKETIEKKGTTGQWENGELSEWIGHFNAVTGKHYKPTKALLPNFLEWRGVYTLEEMKSAVDRIPTAKWELLRTEANPELLLRTMDRTRQPVNRIGELLNQRIKQTVTFHTI